MGAFNLKSKTVLVSLGAILILIGEFAQAGVFNIGAIIDLIKAAILPLSVIFLRHGVSKAEKNAS